eukprot:TRINITY_DN2530_c0_g1_i1.p1 TRINITY_DN2530_c0_g1~~TRINITY_DN2530_c0_g1_i1.p1  ORF type:complete len:537 (-),score=153.95 TRINITY_DN2530_c0_g1_i1:68-1678(-)
MYNPNIQQQQQPYNPFPSNELSPIDPTTKAQYDNKFYELTNRDPNKKFLSGSEGRQFLMQSGLPVDVLGVIWELSDMDKDGNLDRDEFAVAFHLTKGAVRGIKPSSPLPAFLVPKSKEMYIMKQATSQGDWTQFDTSKGQFQVTVPLSNPSPTYQPQATQSPQTLHSATSPPLSANSTPQPYQLIPTSSITYQNPVTYQNPTLLPSIPNPPNGVLPPDQVNPANYSVLPSAPSSFRTQQEIELQRKKEMEELQKEQLRQAQQAVLRQEQEKLNGVQHALLFQASANLQQQQLFEQMQKPQIPQQNGGYSPTYGNAALSPYSPSTFSPQTGSSSPHQTPYPNLQAAPNTFNPSSYPVAPANTSIPNNIPPPYFPSSTQGNALTPPQSQLPPQVRSLPAPSQYQSQPIGLIPPTQNPPNSFSSQPFQQTPTQPFAQQNSFSSQPFSTSDPFGSQPTRAPTSQKPPLGSKADPFGGSMASTSEFSGLTFEPPVLETRKNGPSDGYALGPSASFEQRVNFGSDLEKAMEKLRNKNKVGSM